MQKCLGGLLSNMVWVCVPGAFSDEQSLGSVKYKDTRSVPGIAVSILFSLF